MGEYRAIVCDPPWSMPKSGGYSWRQGARSGDARDAPDYEQMGLDVIMGLGVGELAAPDAHLWLWTTNRWLEHAPAVARAWGFRVVTTCVWSKPPAGWQPGSDAFGYTAEFFLYCRRGKAKPLRRWEQTVFEWSRPLYASGSGERDGHSTKPEAFYGLVEETCQGPYVELFQRRGRLGWEGAGDEALSVVDVAGVRNA